MTLMCKHNELRSFICRTSEPVSDLTGTFPEQKTLNHSWLSNFKQAAELVLNKPLSSLSGTTQSLRIATFTYTMTNKRVLRSQNTHYGSYGYKVSAFSDSFPFQVQEFVFADKDRGATATVAIAKRCERVLTKSSLWCFITADLIRTLVRHGFLQIVRLTSKNRGICPSRLSKLSLCCLSTIPVLVRNNGRLSVTGENWHWSPSTLQQLWNQSVGREQSRHSSVVSSVHLPLTMCRVRASVDTTNLHRYRQTCLSYISALYFHNNSWKWIQLDSWELG